jgi:hypothetical protein
LREEVRGLKSAFPTPTADEGREDGSDDSDDGYEDGCRGARAAAAVSTLQGRRKSDVPGMRGRRESCACEESGDQQEKTELCREAFVNRSEGHRHLKFQGCKRCDMPWQGPVS